MRKQAEVASVGTVRLMRRDQLRRRIGLPKKRPIPDLAGLIAANESARRIKWMLGLQAASLASSTRTLAPGRGNPYFGAPAAAHFAGTRINTVVYAQWRQVALRVYEYENVFLASSGNNFTIFQRDAIERGSWGIVVHMRKAPIAEAETIDFVALCDDRHRPSNPCHVIVDRLPRAHLFQTLANVPEDRCAFIWKDAPFASHGRETVFPNALTLKTDTLYRVKRLLVLSSSFHHQGHPFWYLNDDVVERIVPPLVADLPTPPVRKRKLYLARTDAQKRPLLNEADLMAHLASKGFECLSMGALPPREQLALARSAAVIVAPHGAALTSIFAAQPGTRVIELFNPQQGTAAYAALADYFGLDYTPLFGTPQQSDGKADPWTIDIAAVDTVL